MRRPSPPRAGVARAWLPAALACVVLLTLTAVAALVAASDDRRHAEERQERRLQQVQALTTQRIATTTDRLEDAAAMLAAFDPADPGAREPWHRVVRDRLETRSVFGTGYAQVVDGADRTAFERALGRPIRAPDAAGTLRTAPAADRHVVPILVHYRDGSKVGLGVDLAAEPARRAALDEAERTGRPQLAGPVPVLGGRDQVLLAYDAVRDARGRLAGFTIVSFRAADLMRELEGLVYPGTAFSIAVDGQALAVPTGDLGGARTATTDVGGRELTVAVGREDVLDGDAWAILLAGLLVTSLVVSSMVRTILRERRARQASARDAERREVAESQFATAFEQAPIGMAIVGADRRLARVNEAFGVLLGRRAGALVGTDAFAAVHPDDREAAVRAARRLADPTPAERPGASDGWKPGDVRRPGGSGGPAAERPGASGGWKPGDVRRPGGSGGPAAERPGASGGWKPGDVRRPGQAARIDLDVRAVRPDGTHVVVACSGSALRDADDAVTGWMLQIQDVTDRRAYEERLRHLADHDPLTGLLNRRAFLGVLERHVALVRRYGDRGAVLLADVDHFKAVNDLLGHGAGDRLITDVARGLAGRLRETDVLARLGGDEFAVLLPEATHDEACAVAADLLRVVRATAVTGAVTGRAVSASIGLALVRRHDEVSAESVLVEADLALYDAKDSGRDQVVEAGAPGRRSATAERLGWATRIGDALAADGFEVVFQPIVDLATGAAAGFEALVRLRCEDGRLALPEEFLGVAEHHGLVPKVDAWVLRRVVTDLAALAADGARPAVSVNVSAQSFADPGYAAALEQLLDRHDVEPEQLMFELTESVAVTDLAHARDLAGRLQRRGCRLALDDVGAGFASFVFLKELHFDVLKIDGAFVRGCVTEPMDREIVRSIVAIARERGSRTVAEHVVSAEIADVLLELGVDFAQGFHVGRPGPLPQAPGVASAGAGLDR